VENWKVKLELKKLILTLTVTTTIGMGSLFSGGGVPSACASTIMSDLQYQKEQIDGKQSSVEADIIKADLEINRLQNEQEKVNAEIKRLDLAVGDTHQKIRDKNTEIDEIEKAIEISKGEIVVIEERIEKRNALLKERARSFQESGGMISYIDVLMGSKSFSNFVERIGAVAAIVEADREILRKQQEDKMLLEQQQAIVEEQLMNLQKVLLDLENMWKQLNIQKAEKDKIMETLKTKEEHIEMEKIDLEEEKAVLAAQEALISGASSSFPVVSSGEWTKPTEGRLSSGFGPRWGEVHVGIDIANSADVPIVAAADGVVTRSYYSSSYGNVIFISHLINGQVYTTVYAHMAIRLVGDGIIVSKGQQIGIMGNTGHSFGQHLHFELHKGPWNAIKSNAIDPINYIPM
jgi:peptidoglycan hydrolase CwlO-like protein